jgi:hypothetical protein
MSKINLKNHGQICMNILFYKFVYKSKKDCCRIEQVEEEGRNRVWKLGKAIRRWFEPSPKFLHNFLTEK